MNVEALIRRIQIGPCMYIGEMNFDYLVQFISGFLYNNVSTNRADVVDERFRADFHQWVKRWIEAEQGLVLDGGRHYHDYIQQACDNHQQCLDMFFALADMFFVQLHESDKLI